ncbi:LLM class flavin-dependent oxidoreductase [Nonomuraea sp. NPDC026600]|uniref:LLM class flavin-dependent oxidoreductase n=1 Tax=Nonomuraea sp. NPDC026600 TaxID=3155363 RepID=UPI0033D35CD5
MTARRRGVQLTPMETRREVILATARLADELGYEVFAMPEGWGLDSTAVLAEIALATRRIAIASGVLSVWGRTPATLAMTAATLHDISRGRYVLGLGAGTKALAEGFHDVPFTRPAAKLRDSTTKVRALLAGERARLTGATATRPLPLGRPPIPDLPIWLAAMGSRTLAVTAELADGWLPVFVAAERLAGWAEDLRRTRRPVGDRPLTVAAGPMAIADRDAGAARQVAATYAAWYLCAMGDVYPRLVTRQGYGAALQAVRAANPKPSPRHGDVPAEAQVVLDQFTAYGAPGRIGEQLERWSPAADIVMIGLAPGLPWNAIEATLRAAAP